MLVDAWAALGGGRVEEIDTGYLIAAAALRALTLRARVAGPPTPSSRSHWLLSQPRTDEPEPTELDAAPYLQTRAGGATLVAPPGRLDGEPLRWRSAPPEPGADAPVWR
jgi:hypothetical protein